jgi:hypothetical protein
MRNASAFAGAAIYGRGGRNRGVIIGATDRMCFEGCRGVRLSVRWKDGRTTYPCSKGLILRNDGAWQIE